MKISGIYKITNTITGDFYIGSSKNVRRRWTEHKSPSKWNRCPNNQLYLDMQKYGLDKFVFEIIEEVEIDSLKETEQKFIEILKPTYNNYNANGLNVEKHKESQKKYRKSDKGKKAQKEYEKTDKRKKYKKEYEKTDKRKKYHKEYRKTDKCKEYHKEYEKTDKRKEYKKEYNNQLCFYNGETLTLCALSSRFRRQGIDHPQIEAKKYLIQ